MQRRALLWKLSPAAPRRLLGTPVAMLGPPPDRPALELGWAAGRFSVPDDFDEPLEDEDLWYEPGDTEDDE